MSECVVRMEMPSNCWACPFGMDGYIWDKNDARTHHVRFCSRHSDEEYHVLEIDTIDRPWYCDSFICQLPEGHGELIERQPIIQFIEDGLNRGEYGHDQIEVMTEVFVAPTIVPATNTPTETPTNTPTNTPTATERSET